MADILTKQEVVQLAFSRKVEEGKIPDGLIAAVQSRHLRPMLQKTLYLKVVADLTTYAALIEQCKPWLAQMVKFYVLPNIYTEISSLGATQLQGQNRQPADRLTLQDYRDDTLKVAALYADTLRQWLYDNQATYPDYQPWANAEERVTIAGGIIFKNSNLFEREQDDDAKDDYTQHLTNY